MNPHRISNGGAQINRADIHRSTTPHGGRSLTLVLTRAPVVVVRSNRRRRACLGGWRAAEDRRGRAQKRNKRLTCPTSHGEPGGPAGLEPGRAAGLWVTAARCVWVSRTAVAGFARRPRATPLAARVRSRAERSDTRSGSVMSLPAIATCTTHEVANDSWAFGPGAMGRRRRVGSAAASCHRCRDCSESAADRYDPSARARSTIDGCAYADRRGRDEHEYSGRSRGMHCCLTPNHHLTPARREPSRVSKIPWRKCPSGKRRRVPSSTWTRRPSSTPRATRRV